MMRVLVPSGKLASRRVSKSSANQSVTSIRPIASEARNCPTICWIGHEIKAFDDHDRDAVAFDEVDEIALQQSHGPAASQLPGHRVRLSRIDACRGHRIVARRYKPQDGAGPQHGGSKGQYENPRTPPENQQDLQGGHISDPT